MQCQSTSSVRVAHRRQETEDIISLELQALDGGILPPFEAGAHIDVHIAPGLVRQYSLCNASSERHRYVIGILRDPQSRGGSVAIHERLQPGAIVVIGAPRNHFPLKLQSPSLLIAGGIGVTPMLCMAEALHAAGTAFTLHYCARDQARAAFLDRVVQSPFRENVVFHYDDQDDEQRLHPDELFSQLGTSEEIYVCGPAGFIEWVCLAADRAGIPKHRVRYEHFSAKPVDTSQDGAFDVRIASSGQLFHIPADQSVASVLLAAGVDIYTSCGEGSCGSCVMRLLEGEADHRDVFLTDEEHGCGNQFTPCCSRAKSPLLVLDL
ncbi:oxidoreductase [Achromobacter pestifer]|uniref:Oxidoreductase n=1 Tax=Achromobacter pestifer TaxID=1353889 RepID=A0A7D4E809_9BURK|nr:PDR/VanB family oxidoreductase [Achromobacter pestifer]QKH37326.1 oxidoreductase [Achromobacter pestifer]